MSCLALSSLCVLRRMRVRVLIVPLLCGLILLPAGCANSAGKQDHQILPPAPLTPGATISPEFICIPSAEAAELMLWIEHAERVCR